MLAYWIFAATAGASAGTVSWASPVNGVWSDGARWTGGDPPGPADDAVIAVSGAGYKVTLDVDATVRSLTLGNIASPCSLFAEGRTFSISDTSVVDDTGVLIVRNSMTARSLLSLGSAVRLTNRGITNLRASTVAIGTGSRVDNLGDFACARLCSLRGPGDFFNAADGLVTVSGLGAGGVLVSMNDIVSAGRIDLTDTDPGADFPATLAIPGGTLDVATGGILAALTGNGAGDARTLEARLLNHGRVEVDVAGFAFFLDLPGADHVNLGLIDVIDGTLRVTQSGPTPTFTNNARVDIRGGTTLRVMGVDPDYRQSMGRTILHGGTLDADGDVRICGGTLEGSGDVFGEVFVCGGRLTPGASPGRLVIADGYTQEPNGSLLIELGAFAMGAYDTVVVLGHADLAGSLEVNFLPGIDPSSGDSYPVLEFASRSGTFDVFQFEGRSPAALMDTVFTATNMSILLLSDFSSVEPGASGDGAQDPASGPIRAFTGRTLPDGSGLFELALHSEGRVTLAVYDVEGRRVVTLEDALLGAGQYEYPFGGHGSPGAELPSGMYFALAEARGEDFRASRVARVVLVR